MIYAQIAQKKVPTRGRTGDLKMLDGDHCNLPLVPLSYLDP